MENAKTVKETQVEIAQLMMPEHANPAQNVHGGTIMKMIDEAGAIVAARHAQHHVVTASVDRIHFIAPAFVGNLVIAKASINFVSKTSMEVGVRVEAEHILRSTRKHTASAYLTYVALDNRRRPTEVPKLICETEEEKRRFEDGKNRREERLKTRKKT